MKPRLMLLLPILLALCSPTAAADLETVHNATVRLTAGDGGRGTGTVFERSNGLVWILTCAHVATSPTLQAEFYAAGHESRGVPVTVQWRHEGADLAIARVSEAGLGGVQPAAVPFAPPNHVVPAGARLRTAGSALGVWPTSFVGHAVGYHNSDLHFVPAPANGRSGSAILDDTGRIVGVVRARANDDSYGVATPIQAAYRLWGSTEQRTSATAVQMPTVPTQQPFRYQLPLPGVQRRQWIDGFNQGQSGGGGCPGGVCPAPNGQSSPFGGGGSGLWPTLPFAQSQPQPQPLDQAPTPLPYAPPAVDLGPIADSLGRIGQSLDRIDKRHADQAEAKRQDALRESLPLNSLSGAAGSAVQGDWSGAGASLTGPEMAAWTAGGVAALLAGFFGVRGIFAVLLKFAVAAAVKMGFSYVHGRITAPERTEVDEVIDDVKKPAGSP